MPNARQMDPKDNVAVVLSDLTAGSEVTVDAGDRTFAVRLTQPIELGHKVCVRPMQPGDEVIKYGEVIGRAVTAIEVGTHVHVHNIRTTRGATGDA